MSFCELAGGSGCFIFDMQRLTSQVKTITAALLQPRQPDWCLLNKEVRYDRFLAVLSGALHQTQKMLLEQEEVKVT